MTITDGGATCGVPHPGSRGGAGHGEWERRQQDILAFLLRPATHATGEHPDLETQQTPLRVKPKYINEETQDLACRMRFRGYRITEIQNKLRRPQPQNRLLLAVMGTGAPFVVPTTASRAHHLCYGRNVTCGEACGAIAGENMGRL